MAARTISQRIEAQDSQTMRVTEPPAPSAMLIRWARVEALAERIEGHLLAEGDPNLAQVRADLAQIRALAGAVLR